MGGVILSAVALLLTAFVPHVWSHGRLMTPPSRSSLWRLGYDTPVNWNDNELFCGGFGNQWLVHEGKCGICGDPYEDPQPRDNEAGGLYGLGIITANYTMGQKVKIHVDLTTSHLGYFEFKVCPTNDPKVIATQECLDKYLLEMADGSGTKFIVPKYGAAHYYPVVKLPQGLKCKHCVLQWHYNCGNRWGSCGDGTSALGCGPQETFRGCADVSIL